MPWYKILSDIPFVNTPFPGFIGFLFITSLFAGSNANANAGRESVTKLIHSMCIGNNGSNSLISTIPNQLANSGVASIARNNVIISPTLLESKN